jgi:hypothetical protein
MAVSIQRYIDEFHDGSLIDIQHTNQVCILSLESAEMDPHDMKDGIVLSERNTIKGKLHLENIQSIRIKDMPFKGQLKLKYDYGTIFDFEIRDQEVELQISWRNAPGKPCVNDFDTIKICADHIWWENIPDLFDPFW